MEVHIAKLLLQYLALCVCVNIYIYNHKFLHAVLVVVQGFMCCPILSNPLDVR